MGRFLIWLLLIAAFCLGAAVSYYNWRPVTFNYLAGEVELPLIALLLLHFTAGLLVMWLFSAARIFLVSRDARRHERQVRELEAELKNLRNLPLAGTPAASAPARPAKASDAR